jgi:alkyldihydroxyacetonephosphate synthase
MNATQIRKVLPDTAWRRLEAGLGMPALLVTPARALGDIAPAPNRLPASIVEAMTALLGPGQIRTDLAARADHTQPLSAQLRLREGDLGGVPDAVLLVRNETDVLALLRLCADAGVVVGAPAADAVHVVLDLSALNAVNGPDILSGQVHAAGGLAVGGLDARLAERGLMLNGGDHDGAVAGWAAQARDLCGIRLATPQGLAVIVDDPALATLLAGLGIVTEATFAVRRRPAAAERKAWRFPDFAAGLAALREAARESTPLLHPHLMDEQQTRFFDSLQPEPGLVAQLLARLRKESAGGALLQAELARGDSRRFAVIAARLGGRPCAGLDRMAGATIRSALLERGAAMDGISVRAPWVRLPALYAAARTALEAVMAQQAPREGARGLVLAALREPDANGARLDLSWIFARRLGEDAPQADAIRRRAEAVLTPPAEGLEGAVRAAIAATLDPSAIVKS